MYRRSFMAVATVAPLAGCTGLLGGGVDTTLENGDFVDFDADEGADLTVSVTVQEIEQPDEDVDAERDSIGFQIQHNREGVLGTWSIEDEETFEVTVEHGGEHRAMVTGGVADVSIE
ncbi:hypothetical protein [Halobiforma nitratireducens]|uniref:Uncharacterized protein n=1 Tax=Halobiforma nitratireducens JCM 10879 TaxID=1227454 RepID=M0M639_9EURY|nr:hypothetical protein [Halobiforma nitratireducens]EMA40868.1 hypothetical protein C446_06815 [Halobiforma nitratireducens JCM 10879]